MAKQLTGVARILAEKKAAADKEHIRRLKLKTQLTKLYKEEGIPTEEKPEKTEKPTAGVEKKRRAKPNTFHKQLRKVNQQRIDKEAAIAAKEAKYQERTTKLNQSKEQRFKTHLQLSKKTRKGQPIMAHVISHLLEKIEKN